jgi:pimeloyl-ACP methyl ester carboxylesterase
MLLPTVVGIGVVAVEFNYSLTIAKDNVSGQSDIIATRSGALEYAVAGEGRPVLAIHGLGGGFDQSLDMMTRLSGSGHKVIAPSRFGYLRSALPEDAGAAAQADAFIELLDHLAIKKVAVISYSEGAQSALHFAVRHPDRCSALVLLVPIAFAPTDEEYVPQPSSIAPWVAYGSQSDFVFWASIKTAPDLMISAILGTDAEALSWANDAEDERVERILMNMMPISDRSDGVMNDAATSANLMPVDLSSLKMPVFTISFIDDGFNTESAAAYIANTVQNGRHTFYPLGGHVWAGYDANVFDQVRKFLEQSETELSARGNSDTDVGSRTLD